MSKFKVGDKVKVVFDQYEGMADDSFAAYGINIGDEAEVVDVIEDLGYTYVLSLKGVCVEVLENEIGLVEE